MMDLLMCLAHGAELACAYAQWAAVHSPRALPSPVASPRGLLTQHSAPASTPSLPSRTPEMPFSRAPPDQPWPQRAHLQGLSKPPAAHSPSQHGVHADASSADAFGEGPTAAGMPTPRMPATWLSSSERLEHARHPELELVPSSEMRGGDRAGAGKLRHPLKARAAPVEPISTQLLCSNAASITASPGQDMYDLLTEGLLTEGNVTAQQAPYQGEPAGPQGEEQMSMFGSSMFSHSDSESLTHHGGESSQEDPYASTNLPSVPSPHTERNHSPDHLAAFAAEHYM